MKKEDKVNFLAGFACGPTSDAPVFPVDTIKTPDWNALNDSPVHQYRRMQAREGTASVSFTSHLFRGFPIAMLGSALTFGTHWTIYEANKRFFTPKAEKYHVWTPLVHMWSVLCAQIIASCIRTPFETVKQQMQAGLYNKSITCIKSIYTQGGIKAFYNGYASLLCKNIPYDVIEMTTYEALRSAFMKHKGYQNLSEMSLWQTMSVALCSSGITAYLTTPFDVCKTRMMLASGQGYTIYQSVPETLKAIWKEEGIRGLYSGAIARVIQVAINGAIFFGAFEEYRKYLNRVIKD